MSSLHSDVQEIQEIQEIQEVSPSTLPDAREMPASSLALKDDRPHLSHSQMETFLQCPAKWYADKVLGIRGGPSDALILGNAFHATLEADGERRRMRQTPHTYEELCTAFGHNLRTQLVENDPEGTLQAVIPLLEARGRAMLTAYHREIAPIFHPVAVEQAFTVIIPGAEPDAHGRPWTFTGRIDAVTQPKLGEPPIIVDWKTANKPWRLGDEHHKDQATAYVFADMLEHQRGVQRVTFIVYATQADTYGKGFVCHADVRTTTRARRDVEAYIRKLQSVVRRINALLRTGEPPIPTPNYLCPWCPYLLTCDAGKSWMQMKGKPLPMARTTTPSIIQEETKH